MAYTLTEHWHIVTPKRAVAVIGEDHMGKWAQTAGAKASVDAVAQWHKPQGKITLWHEGETSAISDSFKAFTRHFKTQYPLQVAVKKWEPPESAVKWTRESMLLVGLMAGDAQQTRNHLGKTGIYLDRLMETDAWKASGEPDYTRDEILKLVNKGIHAKRYVELLHSEITDANLKEWFKLREECFDNPNNRLYKIMIIPQLSREDGLARLLHNQNGIFLVGQDHIPSMRQRGQLK
jgi:hypothetical protein